MQDAKKKQFEEEKQRAAERVEQPSYFEPEAIFEAPKEDIPEEQAKEEAQQV